MIERLLKQFAGSGEASDVISQLQKQGLSPQQAQGAVTATAEGTAEAVGGGGLGGMLAGGGGMSGLLGGAMGGGGGLPAETVNKIAATVAQRTGLSGDMARNAVNVVLPRLVSYVTSKMGGSSASPGTPPQ